MQNLIQNMDKFSDWDNVLYSNILTFKALEAGLKRAAAA